MILIKINLLSTLIDSSLATMYICLCNGITDTQIRAAVADGQTSFPMLRRELGLASQCGKCGEMARDVFNQTLSSQSDADAMFYAVGQCA